ncbi:MAG TPA: hypothetical protein PLD55_07165 [bacterium]|nr:hypothetical protein [bacterium]MDX9805258.1 hypothetical protein [bacterium]HNW16174.1 hypothetical protein [bacterium]HOB72363.1 hypothetical protein [bacterium]HOG43461.1 hypothetical protein [bacterium]
MNIREKIILTLSFTGLMISTMLVMNEIELRGYNPSLAGVPSSYIFANSFILIILSVFFLKESVKSILFVAGSTLGISVSIYFSATHLLMVNLSPSLYSVSTSYIFTVLFLVCTVAKYLVIK